MTRHRRKDRSVRDANFIACLLVHGAKPVGRSADLYRYKDDVRAWWLDMNADQNPPMKNSTAYRFWHRYNQWYENQMTNERRNTKCALDIVSRWIE